MIVYNFFGGPCSGKSTTAAYIFSRFKNQGIQVEIAREVAKDFIWEGRAVQLQRNQFLVSALQYSRLKDLKENGCEVAITDSPLLTGLAYSEHLRYKSELEALLRVVNREFDNRNIYLRRSNHYSGFGRVEKASEVGIIDQRIHSLIAFDYEAKGDEQGQILLFDLLWKDFVSGKNQK